MKLVIDRKLWMRGYEKNGTSALMLSDGRMCCLGFHALACGLSVDEIKPHRVGLAPSSTIHPQY